MAAVTVIQRPVEYKSLRAAHAVKTFLGRIAILRTQMRPIVTDRVAWSVSLSVQFSSVIFKLA